MTSAWSLLTRRTFSRVLSPSPMAELIALARIGTPDGAIVVEGGTFETDDENAEILVARGDAELPEKKAKSKKTDE